jgi:dimethylsulfone monooxygenase
MSNSNPPVSHRRLLSGGNRLKIGLFGSNCSSGRTATKAPERWPATWADNLKLVQIADEAGIDFMLPIGRWKGYGGETDYQGATFETITWACGLLSASKRITVFGTVHTPLFHPVIAAKQMVTADHIGQGRFGLNIVVGWNEDEFEMFGVQQREHATRYEFAQEWIHAVKQLWSDREDFEFDGRFFKLKNARAKPKPYGGTHPVIMNAAASATGRNFAFQNCDAFFMQASHVSVEENAKRVAAVKAEAAERGRDISVFTVGVVTCRPTMKEAADYNRHIVVDQADWSAVDNLLAIRKVRSDSMPADEFQRQREHFAQGSNGVPIIGDPDYVAGKLIELSQAGLAGIAISFVNYADELPYFCAEVLPRLERAGLRSRDLS